MFTLTLTPTMCSHFCDSYRNRAEIRASANLGHGSQPLMQFNLRNVDRHAIHAGCLLEVTRTQGNASVKLSLSKCLEGKRETGRKEGRVGGGPAVSRIGLRRDGRATLEVNNHSDGNRRCDCLG